VWRGGQKEKHEKKGPARGLPQGRYQKRELNKNVRGYSAKDLGAILGVAVPGGDAWGALAAAQEESVRNTHSRIGRVGLDGGTPWGYSASDITPN
jgi:hypothetical protein